MLSLGYVNLKLAMCGTLLFTQERGHKFRQKTNTE